MTDGSAIDLRLTVSTVARKCAGYLSRCSSSSGSAVARAAGRLASTAVDEPKSRVLNSSAASTVTTETDQARLHRNTFPTVSTPGTLGATGQCYQRKRNDPTGAKAG